MKQPYPMAPGSVLDFAWDWADWMSANSDSILEFELISPELAVVSESRESAGVVSATISLSEAAELGARFDVQCRIVSSGGRVDSRVISITASWRSD